MALAKDEAMKDKYTDIATAIILVIGVVVFLFNSFGGHWGTGLAHGVVIILLGLILLSKIDLWVKEHREQKALEKYRREFTEQNK